MTQLIECPACEAELPMALLASNKCICPFCKFQFAPSAALTRDRNETPSNIAPITSVPVPRKVAPLRGYTDDGDARNHVPNELSPERLIDADLGVAIQSTRGAIRLPRKKHRAAIWLTLGSLAVLGLVGTTFYFALPSKSSMSSTEKLPFPSAPPIATNVPPFISNVSKTANSPAELSQPPDMEVEWRELKNAPREDYYSLWTKIAPQLVRLQVKTVGIERPVGGVIVDSRGYVATSYQAIRDAIAIEVRSSPKSLLAGEPVGDLSDNVRGLIAADEAHDVAILQINRRFVSTFASVTLAQPRTVLPGERCVLATPPDDQTRLWISDFSLRQVQSWGQLLPQFQTAISDAKLSREPNVSWIVGPVNKKRMMPGSPIFNFNGELVGLLTIAEADSQGIACSSEVISEVLKFDQAELKPFPINPDVVAEVQAFAESSALLPTRDSPAFALADALHQASRSVAQFDFLPNDKTQYEALRKLAESIVNMDDLLHGAALSEGQHLEASSFLEAILDQLQDRVQAATFAHPEKIETFDRLAWEFVEPDHGFVAFGDVEQIGQSITNGLPFVIFILSETDVRVVTTIQHDGPIFLPGTRWLLVGRHVPEVIFRTMDGVKSIEARTCDIRYVFPIEASAAK